MIFYKIMKHKTHEKAFTLIEALCVMAIIAIMASVLLPTIASAKESAKKTVCLSNTKQMALGLYMYSGDYDDTLPNTSYEQDPASFMNGIAYNPANPTGQYQIHWTYLIQPYIRNWNIFVCPSDNKPFNTDNLCPNGQSDVGQLNNGQMYCDWAAQRNSYLPFYNSLPAHDWNVVSISAYASPSNQIMVGEHRDDSLVSTDAGDGDGHKGLSGFWPSQPCGNLNSGLLLPSPTSATKGNASSIALGYTYFNADFLKTAFASAQAAGPDGSAKYVAYFKAYDGLRDAWDRHTSGQGANYSFADGHAKYQSLGQITNPNTYEFGDHWYPTQAIWNASPCH